MPNNNALRRYILGSTQLSAGVGAISILTRWISGHTLTSTPEFILKLGVFGGFGYGLSGVIALILFAKIGSSFQIKYPQESTLGDLITKKLKPAGLYTLLFILCVIGLLTLTIQSVAAIALFKLLNFPVIIGTILLISFCILYAGIGGIVWIQRLASIQISFIFITIIILPLFFFMQTGVQQIYSGIKLYHPYLLITPNDFFFYISIGLLMGIGIIITDLATWQRLFMIQPKKVFPAFVLAGFIFMTIPLAFSSFFIVILSKGGFQNMNTLWNSLEEFLYYSPFLLITFLLCGFSAITSTFGASLHAIVSLFLKNILNIRDNNTRKLLRTRTLIAISIGLTTFIITLLIQLWNVELLFLFSNIFASAILPMIIILYSKDKVSSFIPLSIIIASLVGYASIKFVEPYYSVWISALMPILLISSYYLIYYFMSVNFFKFSKR